MIPQYLWMPLWQFISNMLMWHDEPWEERSRLVRCKSHKGIIYRWAISSWQYQVHLYAKTSNKLYPSLPDLQQPVLPTNLLLLIVKRPILYSKSRYACLSPLPCSQSRNGSLLHHLTRIQFRAIWLEILHWPLRWCPAYTLNRHSPLVLHRPEAYATS